MARGLMVALALVVVLAAPAPSSATPRAEGGGDRACMLPPPDPALVERVRRRIVAQPAPATPFPDGVTGEPHSMPYPPPPGEPLDEDETIELLVFLDQLAACASAGSLGPLLGVLTEDKWVREFGDSLGNLDYVLAQIEATADAPSPDAGVRIELVRAWRLADGRVVAVVKWVSDPPDLEGPFDIDTLLLVEAGGRWLVDDNWYGQGCGLVEPEDCPYGRPAGTPAA